MKGYLLFSAVLCVLNTCWAETQECGDCLQYCPNGTFNYEIIKITVVHGNTTRDKCGDEYILDENEHLALTASSKGDSYADGGYMNRIKCFIKNGDAVIETIGPTFGRYIHNHTIHGNNVSNEGDWDCSYLTNRMTNSDDNNQTGRCYHRTDHNYYTRNDCHFKIKIKKALDTPTNAKTTLYAILGSSVIIFIIIILIFCIIWRKYKEHFKKSKPRFRTFTNEPQPQGGTLEQRGALVLTVPKIENDYFCPTDCHDCHYAVIPELYTEIKPHQYEELKNITYKYMNIADSSQHYAVANNKYINQPENLKRSAEIANLNYAAVLKNKYENVADKERRDKEIPPYATVCKSERENVAKKGIENSLTNHNAYQNIQGKERDTKHYEDILNPYVNQNEKVINGNNEQYEIQYDYAYGHIRNEMEEYSSISNHYANQNAKETKDEIEKLETASNNNYVIVGKGQSVTDTGENEIADMILNPNYTNIERARPKEGDTTQYATKLNKNDGILLNERESEKEIIKNETDGYVDLAREKPNEKPVYLTMG